MTLHIKGKAFYWWKDRFTVRDESGREKYYAAWKGRKFLVQTIEGEELATIEWQNWRGVPCCKVFVRGREVADVTLQYTHLRIFRPQIFIYGLDWHVVSKRIRTHNYEIHCGGQCIALVEKASLTYARTYEVNIADGVDELTALAVVLAINTAAVNEDDGVAYG